MEDKFRSRIELDLRARRITLPPADGMVDLTAMVFLSGCEESALDSLRFPNLPSPFGITCDGMVAALSRRPKLLLGPYEYQTLDTRSDADGES